MAEYIERAEVLKRFEEIKSSKDISFADALYLDGVMAVIDSVPAADVVEVVRCGECKFYSPVEGNVGDCEREDILYLNVKKTDFCSYGVRKENE